MAETLAEFYTLAMTTVNTLVQCGIDLSKINPKGSPFVDRCDELLKTSVKIWHREEPQMIALVFPNPQQGVA